jgi:hypothetical protein
VAKYSVELKPSARKELEKLPTKRLIGMGRRLRYDSGMATVHISEAEAAGDFAGLMAKVRAGAEVV